MADGARAGQAKVAHFAGQVVRAAVEPPVGDDAGAEARAHGEEHHVVAAFARAESMFRHRPGIRVIFDQAFGLEFALQDGLDRHVIPSGQIGRPTG